MSFRITCFSFTSVFIRAFYKIYTTITGMFYWNEMMLYLNNSL